MALDRLEIADMVKWGNLVKSWATGAKQKPTTLQQFKDQCAAAGVGASVPAYVTDFELIQTPSISKLVLRLPPKELVEDSESTLKAGAGYTIPGFYSGLFGAQGGPTNMPTDEAGKMKLHAQRIGDYTMSNCF